MPRRTRAAVCVELNGDAIRNAARTVATPTRSVSEDVLEDVHVHAYQPVEKRRVGGSPARISSWKTQASRLCYGFSTGGDVPESCYASRGTT